MLKIKFALMAFLLLLGTTFAGTIVNVGETVSVGGTTPPSPEPEPDPVTEPEPEPEPQETPGGIILTDEEGDSIGLGTGDAHPEAATYESSSPANTSTDSAPICGTAFVLLFMLGIAFARMS